MNHVKPETTTINISDSVRAIICDHDYGFSGLPSLVVEDKVADLNVSMVYVPAGHGVNQSYFEITGFENGKDRVYSTDCVRLLPAVMILFVPASISNYPAVLEIFKAFVNVIDKVFPNAIANLGSDL